MQIALHAYEDGVRRLKSKFAILPDAIREQMDVIRSKIAIPYPGSANFSLTAPDIEEALCLLPADWLRHAKLERINIVPTQYF